MADLQLITDFAHIKEFLFECLNTLIFESAVGPSSWQIILAGGALGEGLVLPLKFIILRLEFLKAFVALTAQVLDRPCSLFCPRLTHNLYDFPVSIRGICAAHTFEPLVARKAQVGRRAMGHIAHGAGLARASRLIWT